MDRFWGDVGGRPAIDPLNNVDDAAGLSESFFALTLINFSHFTKWVKGSSDWAEPLLLLLQVIAQQF